MRITYNVAADAVYIQVTERLLTPGRTSIRAGTPAGVQGFIVLDWKDHRLAPPRLSRRGRTLRINNDSVNLLPAAAEMRRPQLRSRLAQPPAGQRP